MAVDGRAVAVFGIADTVRETSKAAVEALHDAGVRVVMLTGEDAATAQRIADEIGIDTDIAEVLPEDKSTHVVELQNAGRMVAMVGDGVNAALTMSGSSLVVGSSPCC